MSNAVVVHLTKLTDKGTLASQEIARFISNTLQLPLIDTEELCLAHLLNHGQPHTVIMVNSPTAFCSWRPRLAELWANAPRRIFAQNDYTLAPPSQVARAWERRGFHGRPPMEAWSTVPHKGTRYANWNVLGWPEQSVYRARPMGDGGFIYWGAARTGRREQLMRYMNTTLVAWDVSCSAAAKRWFDGNTYTNVVHPFTGGPGALHAYLGHYAATIYLEDEYSHKYYTSPATRFYEALAAGLAIFFDKASVPTMRLAGFDVRDYVVSKPGDIDWCVRFGSLANMAGLQRHQFVRPFREELASLIHRYYADPQPSNELEPGQAPAWPATDGHGPAWQRWEALRAYPMVDDQLATLAHTGAL